MELRIDGHPMTVAVTERSAAESPHTGKQLETVEAEFRTGSVEARDHFSELFGKGVDVESSDGRRYRGALRSHSYENSSPIASFVVELKELEEVQAERVVIDGSLVLVPDRYEEDYRDQAIVVSMLTTTVGPATDQLEAAITGDRVYFPVVREGVRDTPTEMRFGRCLWEDRDEDGRRHFIVLVERSLDESPQRSWAMQINQPALKRSQDAIATLQTLVNLLSDRLVDAGVVTADEVASIREQAQQVTRPQLRQFDQAADVDEFFV